MTRIVQSRANKASSINNININMVSKMVPKKVPKMIPKMIPKLVPNILPKTKSSITRPPASRGVVGCASHFVGLCGTIFGIIFYIIFGTIFGTILIILVLIEEPFFARGGNDDYTGVLKILCFYARAGKPNIFN